MDATFIASTIFSVVGDSTAEFVTDRKVEAYCGVSDGYKYCIVESSQYVAPNTIITISGDAITANLESVLFGIVSPGPIGSQARQRLIGCYDFPASYTGASGKPLTINDAGTAVEFSGKTKHVRSLTALVAADTDISIDTIVLDAEVTLTADLTISKAVFINPGCQITLGNYNLTISGALLSQGDYQQFNCSGSGKVSGLSVVNIKHFGAVSDWDGATGTDNAAAFAAARDAVLDADPAVNPPTLYVPKGFYYTTVGFDFSGIYNYVEIKGVGYSATGLVAGATMDMIKLSFYNVGTFNKQRVSNLGIYLNGQADSVAINAEYSRYTTIENCYISMTGTTGSSGIKIGNWCNRVINNYIVGETGSPVGTGLWLNWSTMNNVIVRDNVFSDLHIGIDCYPYAHQLLIDGNTFDKCYGSGVVFRRGCRLASVTNNYFEYSGQDGVEVQASDTASVGDYVTETWYGAIVGLEYYVNPVSTTFENLIVTGNQFAQISSVTVATFSSLAGGRWADNHLLSNYSYEALITLMDYGAYYTRNPGFVIDQQDWDGKLLFTSIVSADPAADTITLDDQSHVVPGLPLYITGGSLPGGLTSGTIYYAVAKSDTTTLQVSATLGGSAVNITSSGVGTISKLSQFTELINIDGLAVVSGSTIYTFSGMQIGTRRGLVRNNQPNYILTENPFTWPLISGASNLVPTSETYDGFPVYKVTGNGVRGKTIDLTQDTLTRGARLKGRYLRLQGFAKGIVGAAGGLRVKIYTNNGGGNVEKLSDYISSETWDTLIGGLVYIPWDTQSIYITVEGTGGTNYFSRLSLCDASFDLLNAPIISPPPIGEVLLGRVTANLSNTDKAKTIVYTVPTGYSAVITKYIVRNPSASLAGGTEFDLGSGAVCTTWRQNIDLSTMTASTDYMEIISDPTTPTKYTREAAGAEIGIIPVTGATASPVNTTVEVWGYLY